MTTPLETPATYADFSRFEALRTRARTDASGTLGAVSKEFEALFLQMMLKAARDAEVDGGLFGSPDLALYREMMDDQIALTMAGRGALDLESVLRAQIEPREGAPAGARTLDFPAVIRSVEPLPDGFDPPFASLPDTVAAAPPPAPGPAEIVDDEVPDVRQAFVRALQPHAQRAAQHLGTSAEVLIAQAALETGWGRHAIRHPDGRDAHNLFGIKADRSWAGPTVRVDTLEYFGDNPVRVNAAFRSYTDVGAAFADYTDFLETHPRYGRALARGANGAAFVTELARAGYATDPAYARKVLAIAQGIDRLPLMTASAGD